MRSSHYSGKILSHYGWVPKIWNVGAGSCSVNFSKIYCSHLVFTWQIFFHLTKLYIRAIVNLIKFNCLNNGTLDSDLMGYTNKPVTQFYCNFSDCFVFLSKNVSSISLRSEVQKWDWFLHFFSVRKMSKYFTLKDHFSAFWPVFKKLAQFTIRRTIRVNLKRGQLRESPWRRRLSSGCCP